MWVNHLQRVISNILRWLYRVNMISISQTCLFLSIDKDFRLNDYVGLDAKILGPKYIGHSPGNRVMVLISHTRLRRPCFQGGKTSIQKKTKPKRQLSSLTMYPKIHFCHGIQIFSFKIRVLFWFSDHVWSQKLEAKCFSISYSQ